MTRAYPVVETTPPTTTGNARLTYRDLAEILKGPTKTMIEKDADQ